MKGNIPERNKNKICKISGLNKKKERAYYPFLFNF